MKAVRMFTLTLSAVLTSGGSFDAQHSFTGFKSTVPSYPDKLTTQEFADLLSYRATLKGQAN